MNEGENYDAGSRFFQDRFITEDPEILRIRRCAQVLSGCGDPLFIAGEAGTGKTLLSRLIHEAGQKTGPLVFYPEQGGFSFLRGGPTPFRKEANLEASTLCMAGFSGLTEADQKNLLRYLETGRLVSREESPLRRHTPRIIFESRRTLKEHLSDGEVLPELYYFLTAHEIILPPLRDRSRDIIPLARVFLSTLGETGTTPPVLSRRSAALLERYSYPGNVEELKMIIQDSVKTNGGRRVEVIISR